MKNITNKALAIAVPTAFPELFPDQWEHDHISNPDGSWGCIKDHCSKCKKCGRRDDEGSPTSDYLHEWYETSCTVPTPIVIDWNTAHKVVAEVSPLEFMRAMVTVYIDKTGIKKPTSWEVQVYLVKPECTPADYLRAALEAVKGVE